jgi:lipopolysaccharide/colanic/teichoic acid biosynthesis glycosyltransferase
MRREILHQDDLLKPDLFGEIVLALSGIVIFMPLLLIVALALTQNSASW